jgi:hypothetical protein
MKASRNLRTEVKWERFFLYRKRFGIPILSASIKIQMGFREGSLSGDSCFRKLLGYLGAFFRMNNRFLSVVEAESYPDPICKRD